MAPSIFSTIFATVPETIAINSRSVTVLKFSWEFQEWTGPPVADTYGNKAILDSDGEPLFAELALIPILKQRGFEGAVWVDTYRRKFRDAMPPTCCELPANIRRIYDEIAKINRSPGGCWDVLAWRDGRANFVECKRKGKDRMRPNGIAWLAAGLQAGLAEEHFAVCEWNLRGELPQC